MEFTNCTPFPAAFQTGSPGDREMLGIAVCKITHAFEKDRLVAVTGDQAWPVFEKPFVFDGVTLGPEVDFRKNGVDMIVFGKAMAPGGKPVASMHVSIQCGTINYQVMVTGERRWEKSWGRFKITEPVPFLQMALTNDRAFGGESYIDDAQILHTINPEGRGLCLSKKHVDGTRLPNLEQPDCLIENWYDQPEPACLYKPTGPLGLGDISGRDIQEVQGLLLNSFFNQAVPNLVATRAEDLGESIRLEGFCPDGPIIMPVPKVNGPTMNVSVGQLRGRFPSTLSTLVVLATERIVIATYLCLFRYLFRPMEMRSAQMRWED